MTTRHSKLAVANPRRARIASPRREPPAETRETVRNGGSQAAQELKALRRLNEASARLWQTQNLNQGLREMLMAAIDLLGADFGNIQIYHPSTATLRIAAQRGFKRKFLDFFHEVSTNDDSACGRALRSGRRIIIEDVAKDAAYAPYREIARAAGYRGVQSTPLIAHDGRPLGMLSTHFRRPHRTDEIELERLDLYARQAADFIQRCQREEAHQKSETRFRALVEASSAVTWSCPSSGLHVAPQPSWMAFTGQTAKEMLGAGWTLMVHPDDIAAAAERWKDAVARGEPFSSVHRIRRHDGHWRWMSVHAVPLRDSNGTIVEWFGMNLDITERAESHEAQRYSEARLRLAAAAGNVGLWDWNLRTNDVYFSPDWKRQIGYRDDEVPNQFEEWEKRLHPDDLKPTVQKLRTFLKNPEGRHELEFRFHHKDGGYRWIYSCAEVLRDPSGEPTRMLGCHLDITDRKRAEEELQALNTTLEQRVADRTAAFRSSESKFRQLYESLHDAYAQVDMEGRIREFNAAFADMLGYSGGELRQLRYQDITPDKWHGFEERIIRRQVLRRGFSGVYQKEYRRKDDTVFPVELRTSVILDDSGTPQGMWAIVRDITARERAEAQLRHLNVTLEQRVAERTLEVTQREERLRAILNTVQDAVITIDHGGIILSANPATERLFGYTVSELLGQNVKLLMPSPHHENHDRYLANYHRTGEAKVIGIGREVMAQRRNGETFPVELSVSEVDHLDLFTGVVRDITQRKRLERELLDSTERMQREFGHELHDGLGQRLTGLEMLSHRLAERLKREVSLHAAEAQHLNRELRETVTQARLISHSLAPVPLDGDGLMRSLAELAASTGRLPGVRCRFLCDPPVRLDDTAAATHLYRITQEAVNNALKHGRARRVDISLKEGPQGIELRVENTGRTLRKEHLRGNHGMGFHLMRYRADMTGATLTIEPRKPRGARVICTLRRKYEPEADCSSQQDSANIPSTGAKHRDADGGHQEEHPGRR